MTFRQRIAATTGFILVLIGLGALLPLIAKQNEPREIQIAVRQMAFYLGEDRSTPNPVIRIAPGERIRLTLISKDAGFNHNFAVGAWQVTTSMLHGEGTTSLVFQAPKAPGTAAYVCSLHEAMMKGTIVVDSSAKTPASSSH
jgi:plastocyanin